MHIVLFIFGIISLLAGIGTCTMAKGAIHEIEGLVWTLVAAVLISSGAIIEAIRKQGEKQRTPVIPEAGSTASKTTP